MNRVIKKKEITDNIISIMKNRIKLRFDADMENIVDIPLLGDSIGVEPYELCYMVVEVEKEYDFRIPESYLLDPGVQTINDFVEAIRRYS